MRIGRRHFLAAAGASALPLGGFARAAVGEARDLKPIKLPPPIGRDERLARVARGQALMAVNGQTAILVESGSSLDYSPGCNGGVLQFPGKFGIRLEDCFHMTATGPRYFSEPPRSLDQPV